jgi:helicase
MTTPVVLHQFQQNALDLINTPTFHGLLIVAPTGAGKTKVVDFCTPHGKTVLIGPLRALSSQQYRAYSQRTSTILDTGETNTSFSRYNDPWTLAIMTFEKCDAILRSDAKREQVFPNVKYLIIDEIHQLGHPARGVRIESAILKARILYPQIKLIGLSATIANADEISKWLGIDLISVDKSQRPIPLQEDLRIYNLGHSFSETFNNQVHLLHTIFREYPDDSFLIFCATPDRTRALAAMDAAITKPTTNYSAFISTLIARGIGCHFAGLSKEDKERVEQGFEARRIKHLYATTTLCLPPSEKIVTFNGIREIKDIEKGELVLTSNGQFEQVLDKFENFNGDTLVKIYPYYALPMEMTPNHRVLVVKGHRKVNHSRKPIYNGKCSKAWWEYGEKEWVMAKDLYKPEESSQLMVLVPRIKKEIELEVSDDFLLLAGFYISEGSLGKNGVIKFDINIKEEAIAKDIIEAVKNEYKKNCTVKDNDRHGRDINFCSKEIMGTFLQFGKGAFNKQIPDQWLYMSKRQLSILVRSLWRGDGTFGEYSKNSDAARYVTVSSKLAHQIWLILIKLGYLPSITTRFQYPFGDKEKDQTVVYTVAVSGAQLPQFAIEVLEIAYIPRERNRSYNVGMIDSEYAYFPIRKVETTEYNGKVYNLEIEGDHSYTGNFIVHNSQGVNLPSKHVCIFDITRWSWLRSSDEYIELSELQQSIGRAGRPGYDTEGYAHILCSVHQERDVRRMLKTDYKVASQVHTHLRELLLEWNCSRIFETLEDFDDLSPFLFGKISSKDLTAALLWLVDKGFLQHSGDRYFPTYTGNMTSKLYIAPETALVFEKAQHLIDDLALQQVRLPSKLLFSIFLHANEFLDQVVVRNTQPDQQLVSIGQRELGYDYCLHCHRIMHRSASPCCSSSKISLCPETRMMKAYALAFAAELGKKYQIRVPFLSGERTSMIAQASRFLNAAGVISRNKQTQHRLKGLNVLIQRGSLDDNLADMMSVEGIGEAYANKLFQANIRTVAALITTNLATLTAIFKSEKIAAKILENAKKAKA